MDLDENQAVTNVAFSIYELFICLYFLKMSDDMHGILYIEQFATKMSETLKTCSITESMVLNILQR